MCPQLLYEQSWGFLWESNVLARDEWSSPVVVWHWELIVSSLGMLLRIWLKEIASNHHLYLHRGKDSVECFGRLKKDKWNQSWQLAHFRCPLVPFIDCSGRQTSLVLTVQFNWMINSLGNGSYICYIYSYTSFIMKILINVFFSDIQSDICIYQNNSAIFII